MVQGTPTISGEQENEIAQAGLALRVIAQKEPHMLTALLSVIKHVEGTYSDKYDDIERLLKSKNFLYDPEHGKHTNIYQCVRYMQRYLTQKFGGKSDNSSDLKKGIHYLLFELVRRILSGGNNNNEVTDK